MAAAAFPPTPVKVIEAAMEQGVPVGTLVAVVLRRLPPMAVQPLLLMAVMAG